MIAYRMKLLADEVETPTLALTFNMQYWCNTSSSGGKWPAVSEIRQHPCGTMCCIAGTAIILFGDDTQKAFDGRVAGNLLGLTELQQNQLFNNYGGYIVPSVCLSGSLWEITMLSSITRAQAAAAIRRMVAEEEASKALVEETPELVSAR